MLDTLKLARRLEAANLPKAQAEALAEGLNESRKENYVTNERFDLGLAKLKNELVFWMFGVVGLGVLVNHFWK